MAGTDAGLRRATVYSLLRCLAAESAISRGVLYGDVDRHIGAVYVERAGHGNCVGDWRVDAEADVSVSVLSAGAGGGAGDGARPDTTGQARLLWRGRGAGVVLHRDLDGCADAGSELGGMATGEVHGTGSAAAGANKAGNLPVLDGVLLPAWLCLEAAADKAVLLGRGGGGGVKE